MKLPKIAIIVIVLALLITAPVIFVYVQMLLPFHESMPLREFPIDNGRIWMLGKDLYMLDCVSGEYKRIDWFTGSYSYLDIYCPNHSGGFIAGDWSMGLSFSLKDSTIQKIDIATDGRNRVIFMDYYGINNIYAYSGRDENRIDTYVLDTNFNVIRDITPLIPYDLRGGNIRFIDEKTFLYDTKGEIYIINTRDSSISDILHGYVRDISHNRDKILYRDKYEENLFIYDMKTHDTIAIKYDSKPLGGVFSPDDRYIAFAGLYTDYSCVDCIWIYFYDIEKRELFTIRKNKQMKGLNSSSFIWVE